LQKIVGMGKITLNLLENGLDFLCEALTPIVQTQDERKLKYSVLHICAGVELILKKIVFDINWQWIFKDESKASEQALSTGNFESINFGGIKYKLSLAGLNLPLDVVSHIEALRRKRNMIEHYAMQDEIASALRGNVSVVLDDVINLINKHITFDTSRAKRLYDELRRQAAKFREYNDRLLERLEPELQEARDNEAVILQCPSCFLNFLTAIPGEEAECLHCHYRADPEKLADDTLERIEEVDAYTIIKDGGEYPQYDCPICHFHSLIRYNNGTYHCFNCDQDWDAEEIRYCTLCGEIYEIDDDDLGLCRNCMEQKMSIDD
uniref:hypothetical protein n=2 Tax=Alistipes sp. TaxID=1872444 RepID=UPI003AABC029